MSNICPICKSRPIVEGSIIVACELCRACILLDRVRTDMPEELESHLSLTPIETQVYYKKMWADLRK